MDPVADIEHAELPTLKRLGLSALPDVDPAVVAQTWFQTFAENIQANNVDGVLTQLVDDVFWRDILAFTWDFRTFFGSNRVKQFLVDRLSNPKLSHLQLDTKPATLQRPYPDIVWVQAFFTFSTAVGTGTGIFRLVPMPNGDWKAHAIFTNLESLHGFPELTDRLSLMKQESKHGTWEERWHRERECEGPDQQPVVIVVQVGGGLSGLELGRRLTYLGIKTLVVEREARIGYDHRYMPYLPFPPTWPVFSPVPKIEDWLDSNTHAFGLVVWTSSTVTKASQDPETKKWTVQIERTNGEPRSFVVNHLVFAVGFGDGTPNVPQIPGAEIFKGTIVHSSSYTTARDYKGKEVVVVGACSSGHDIAMDLYDNGVDVTMFQRSSTYVMSLRNGIKRAFGGLYCEGVPPPDVADRLNASFPIYLQKPIHKRIVVETANDDKEWLDGLRRVGFRLNTGIDDTGFMLLVWSKAGGYHFDVGASQLIGYGKIKLKNDATQIVRFTQNGLEFDNGSTLYADAVIFATGFCDAGAPMREVLGSDVGARLKPIWGLDPEGEINGVSRDVGIPRLWCMMGNFALCRFHSKHIALQIKAIEEKIFDEKRYSLETERPLG